MRKASREFSKNFSYSSIFFYSRFFCYNSFNVLCSALMFCLDILLKLCIRRVEKYWNQARATREKSLRIFTRKSFSQRIFFRFVSSHNSRTEDDIFFLIPFRLCIFFLLLLAFQMYAITWQTNLISRLGEMDVFILLISCICHDLDHPGYNNVYQINAKTELALR